jgi:hypothetical protein
MNKITDIKQYETKIDMNMYINKYGKYNIPKNILSDLCDIILQAHDFEQQSFKIVPTKKSIKDVKINLSTQFMKKNINELIDTEINFKILTDQQIYDILINILDHFLIEIEFVEIKKNKNSLRTFDISYHIPKKNIDESWNNFSLTFLNNKLENITSISRYKQKDNDYTIDLHTDTIFFDKLHDGSSKPSCTPDFCGWCYYSNKKIKYECDKMGKWLLFYDEKNIDKMWENVKSLYNTEKLKGVSCMKVSLRNCCIINKQIFVIVIYCGPHNDKNKIMNIGKNIVKLLDCTKCARNANYIYYKSNEQTRVKSIGGGSLYKISVPSRIQFISDSDTD